MRTQESSEDYLESILILGKNQQTVRAVDIAARLGFSAPSVSFALKKLRENGMLDADSGDIVLTEAGRAVAESVYARHLTISEFLIGIGVDEETALIDACRMEHVISELTFEKLRDFAKGIR